MLLLITDRTHLAGTIAERLLSHGIYHLRATLDTALFLCTEKDVGGVILDCVTDPKKAESLCRTLRQKYERLPIAAIRLPHAALDIPADRLFSQEDTEVFCSDVLDFCRCTGWKEERMDTFDLSIGTTPHDVLYMGYPFSLSPREYTILRCLFYRSPKPTASDDLMSMCYPGEKKSISNLAVTVRNINLRAREIDPRPLIVNVYAQGYRLRDGVLEEHAFPETDR